MNISSSWEYKEIQIGKDYNTLEEVEAYDARHGTFRNIDEENDKIVKLLRLAPEQSVIDIGTGTGAFALRAARSCAMVYAIDISSVMLEYAARKSRALGVKNIVFCHAGFLTYRHTAAPVDAIVTSTAMHHLPDFWKGIALHRINNMMKTGGHLFLSDVIFSPDNTYENIEKWISKLEQIGGSSLRQDVEAHISKEYSTFDWVMDGLLERAGFCIVERAIEEGVVGKYLCRKDRGTHNPYKAL